jgi:subtilisin family serine protease
MTLPEMRYVRRAALGIFAAAVTAAVATSPAAAAPVFGEIKHAGGPNAVANSYIVVLKDSAVSAKAVHGKAGDLASRFGGSVGHTYDAALRGFEVRLSESAAKRLAAHRDVAYVEQNQTVSIQATQTGATWGLDRIDQRNRPLNSTYTYPNTASNVNVAIIDTGIRRTHTDLRVSGSTASRVVGHYDAITSGGTANDCNGHGTHVAGTAAGNVYGVAKQARLYAVRVLNCSGSGTNAQVIAGINWVTSNLPKPAVANMSLGGSGTALNSAVANSIAAGITYAVAAGNSNANACNFTPAGVSTAITVGATTNTDARASFSNFGTCVDIFAPGQNITSAWYTSDSATNTISGTSMASPHVAGAAALVLSANPSWTPAQVKNYLISNATTGVVTSPGSGSPNRLLYVVN